MRSRALLLIAILALGAAPAPPRTAAPDAVPHSVAIFLDTLSQSGKRKLTMRAEAVGTHFFIEEPSGVTVYTWNGSGDYRKETFLRGATLAKAVARYR